MLLDAAGAVAQFVDVFSTVYALTLILYVLTSWVQLPYSLKPVHRFLYDVCEPYLRLWRRIIPVRAGPIDFSPMVAILALFAVRQVLVSILNRL
jgi:YggT family protein